MSLSRSGEPAAAGRTGPGVRIDAMSIAVRRTSPDGVTFEITPPGRLTAAETPVLPIFEGWVPSGELTVRLSGVASTAFSARLDLDGVPIGDATAATLVAGDAARPLFELAIAVPLRALAAHIGRVVHLGLSRSPGGPPVRLATMTLSALRAAGPGFTSLDLSDATDAMLFDAPERRLFDLQNPEEGLWAGTGKWRLRLSAEWAVGTGDPYALEARPQSLSHGWEHAGDVLVEDATRRSGGRRTSAELLLDTSHAALLPVPAEGRDVPLDVTVEHALTFGASAATLRWSASLPVRLRDPSAHLRSFERLSAVGIDFGTTATVAALYQRGFRSLLRLGGAQGESSAENPTYLLIEDHERLWTEMARAGDGQRFPNLLRVVRGSHPAREAMGTSPSAVVPELKSLPERVISLDQSPQLRDRERQRDFLLDEARVRVLIRTYAYLLGRAINRPGQDVYLHYWLTHPAKFDERSRILLEEELRNGILLSIPQGIPASAVTVGMRASEPEAFAAEVCPELAAHPALEPLIAKFGELRFAVFDFGGGTLDIACGRFRPATPKEQEELGGSAVIETLQVSGDAHLGGDYLTHELTFLTHQYPRHLPEMEQKEVPMMRPQTVPPDNLANKPHLYKRSLAGRQNRVRIERELQLERVKHGPEIAPRKVDRLDVARLDGTEVEVTSLGSDVPGLHAHLAAHLDDRIRDGAKLLRTMLASTPWSENGGTSADWRAEGVVLLLAGNSSRSAYVERALGEELGLPDLEVWRPGSTEPFTQVVLYETAPRMDRGVSIVGVSPKTAVALGALKIANREVHLVRRAQGFSYFLGDLRGFPPKFVAALAMGAAPTDPTSENAAWVDLGRWDAQMPLRVCKEYEPGKMTSSDPRLSFVPTGLPAGETGRLSVCVIAPEQVALRLDRTGGEPLLGIVNLAQFMR